MNQKQDNHPVNQRFADVKKGLDPSKSYLIFENDLTRSEETIFSSDLVIYRYMEKHQIIWQQIRDEKANREYLVIQTEPGNESEVLGRLMGTPFPKEIVLYVYNANRP